MRSRKGKELWTEHEAGDKVHCYTAMNEHDEAQFVAADPSQLYPRAGAGITRCSTHERPVQPA